MQIPFQYVFFAAGALVGFVIGALLVFIIAGRKKAKLEQELALSRQECGHRAEEIARLADDTDRRKTEFAQLSEEVLYKRQQSLNAENIKSINALIEPVKTEFENLQRLVNNTRMEDNRDIMSLQELVAREMKHMQELAGKVGEDARGLKAALLGNVNARGQWGEALLEGLLRDSGLLKDIHYTTQVSITDDDGKGRPDMVIHQPDGTNVVIDSKALFPNYYQYIEAESPEDRKRALAEHLQSVRDTINNLSKRHYETRVEGSIDFVIMFFPLEGAYQLLLSGEPAIITSAMAKHVLPVGPSTLIVMLTIIERMWRRNEQDRNAQEILKAAQELADRVIAFGTDLDAVGKGLEIARTAYDSAVSRLSSQDGRSRSVKSSLVSLENLKVKSAHAIPRSMS